MIICPVCKKKITNGFICTECGHDESRNVENYLSLVRISGNMRTLSGEIEAYQNKLAEIRLRTLMEAQLNAYETRIKKLETQISDQKNQILDQKNQLMDQQKRLEGLERLKGPADQLPQKAVIGNKYSWTEGGIVTFGAYMIHENNKKEPLEWLVLNRQRDKFLLLSRYGLNVQRYDYGKDPWKITWDKSLIRGWLNGAFYLNAFNEQEKQKIVSVSIGENAYSVGSIHNPGFYKHRGTDYQVFLLSKEEVSSYLKTENERKAELTSYARGQASNMKSSFCREGAWWLRSQGKSTAYVAYVAENGCIDESGENAMEKAMMVRPAMWVVHEA